MRKPSAILLALGFPLCAYSQGSFVFDNIDISPIAPVTISATPGTFNPANGPAGAFVGSNYTASAYYLNGTVTDQAIFDGSNPILVSSANTMFFGTTGSDASNGAGLFDGGLVTLPTTGIVTVQVRAWYNGGGLYTSYSHARAEGQNVGESIPVSLILAIGSQNPTPLEGLLPFTVGIVPEPSSFVLIGLGGLALLQFARQRK